MAATYVAPPGAPAPVRSRRADLRTPDPADSALMTRRAWWLLALHVLIPGAPQAIAGSRRLGRFALGVWLTFWIAVLASVVLGFVLPQLPLTLVLNGIGLTVVQALLVGWGILYLVLTVDTFRLVRVGLVRPIAGAAVPIVLAVALVLTEVVVAQGVSLAGTARDAISKVFHTSGVALPSNGRYNVLVLGGDAGAGRSGLRPDSISVASFDALTGRMVMLGLPRNLGVVPFPADSPMHAKYPHGYGYHDTCNVDVCQLNSIYTEVELKSPQLYPDAKKDGLSPGIEATRDAVEGALGIPIQYTVLINMDAFSNLIDAMGGVVIDVKERLPIGGGVDANGHLTGVKVWIEKGRQRLNGNRAMWYARSRHSTSDYDRMARQRELENAMIRQLTPATLVSRFGPITRAAAKTVQTDMPQTMLGVFAGLAVKSKGQKATTVEFVPPRVPDPTAPDYAAIHRAVQKALG
jgi:LCP family protein required for cell wall assembly